MPSPEQIASTAGAPARVRLLVALAAGVAAAVPVALFAPLEFVPLAGWDVAALVWLTPVLAMVRRWDAGRTAAVAVRDDPSRPATDLLLLAAAVASLAAVGTVLVQAADLTGADRGLQVGLAVGSVVLSWTVVHCVYALRYARLYYGEPRGGIDFNSAGEPPCYADFAYLAFTVGMCFQVSDTPLTTAAVRRTALRHGLLSYLFGTVIVATAINLGAGLGR